MRWPNSVASGRHENVNKLIISSPARKTNSRLFSATGGRATATSSSKNFVTPQARHETLLSMRCCHIIIASIIAKLVFKVHHVGSVQRPILRRAAATVSITLPQPLSK